MNAEQLDRKLRAIVAPVKELDREYAEVMDSIRPRLDAIKVAMDVARTESSIAAEKLWLETTYEDFIDPLKYQLISEMVWKHLGGDAGGDHIGNVLLPNTYVQKRLTWYGYGEPLMTFEFAIPKVNEKEKLSRTAELMAPIIRAATENDDKVRFSVMEDNLSLYGVFYISYDPEEKLFHLEGAQAYEHEDLLEVLKRTPTYY